MKILPNSLWVKKVKIKISNLTKKYKDLIAVNDVSFEINDKQIFAILGINGAGKTTTVKMMCGLTPPDSGDIFYDNLSAKNDIDKIKSLINVSPQETAVAENLTVNENLLFIAGIYGFDKQKSHQKADEIIKRLSLDNVKNKKAKLLSGGMQRRLSLAMALISEPQILFLDEPTLGLDVLARAELWKFINALKAKMTVILTTHYMEEAENLADTVAIMKDGKIIAIDSPKKLLSQTDSNSLEQAFIKIVKGNK